MRLLVWLGIAACLSQAALPMQAGQLRFPDFKASPDDPFLRRLQASEKPLDRHHRFAR
ncbi:MAG TPA: hypothetical protein VN660_12050 [Steroidobacteraceae bacterium]|nr:hypothetical protein [Steroidobacteraceae bacterium]